MSEDKEQEAFIDLLMSIDAALDKRHLDDVIPALTIALGTAGVAKGTDKKVLIAYVANTIDRVYEEAMK
jgi:hypothetical protein